VFHADSQSASERVRTAGLALAPLALILLMWWFARWTGAGRGSAAADAAWLLVSASWPGLLWIGAAIGLGLPLRMLLLRAAKNQLPLQIALGFAAMLFLDATLGAIGALQIGGSVGAWLLTGLGCALAAAQLARWVTMRPRLAAPNALVWTCLPALAVLLLASTSAPGWLWSTEFGGYDALSYHLELPKEWLAHGKIVPLQHNVYSFLPGYVEAAYYHLAVLAGDAIEAAYACQLLHALMAIMSAWLISRIGKRIGGSMTGVVAAVVMLGTPWVIVTGSLAYNEMAVTLMLAAGLLAAMEMGVPAARRGALIGIFAASACAAKLSALGLAAWPLAIVLLLSIPRTRWIASFGSGAIVGLIVLMPWLIRNAFACGNPVFPFGTDLCGLAHWTAEQATVWRLGHSSDATVGDQLVALWNQFLRFGVGVYPRAGEPWKPQWIILPWLGLIGLAIGVSRPRLQWWSLALILMLFVQLAFWMFFTHLQSRFLLPAVVPLCLGAAMAATTCVETSRRLPVRRALTGVLALGLVAWCGVPVMIFRDEADGSPAAAIGMASSFTGDDLTAAEQLELGTNTFPAIFVNKLLPAGDKVLLVGEAAPLYFDSKRIAYSTVWDRGVLSRLLRQHPDDPAAWINALRDGGFSHVLINPGMLERWERSGWNDPMVTADRVTSFAREHLRLVGQYPRGELLFEVP
jgi:hypothetical protein